MIEQIGLYLPFDVNKKIYLLSFNRLNQLININSGNQGLEKKIK
jgi:hypothetical protein